MRFFVVFLTLTEFVLISGCGLFKNRREQIIMEKLEKIQENFEKRADSLRMERYRTFTDSSNKDFMRTMDSLKKSSDSLQKSLKKNIEELKKKNN
jgi:hypothetical protein